ncbi:MAG: thioredoxin domain-containing protein, partial [Armatimonadota bacterium]|nr:thioredoxin domain-containing protein [Armatimonadota bacterium]
PAGIPFYGGTYFPPVPRGGMPAFVDVLRAIAEAWRTRRDQIERGGAQVLELLARARANQDAPEISTDTVDAALAALGRSYDLARGGWGGAPKFPQPMTIEFLLRTYVRTGDRAALAMATATLEHMARGGIYDHLGGGFHRYATDAVWVVPHFEKMLYDNAQLARVYACAWQVTGTPLLRRVAEETLDYLVRRMRDPAGGFYSSEDADSEGEEGRFYVWSTDEIRSVLGADADLFMDAYGVRSGGNFDGKHILHLTTDAQTLAERYALPPGEVVRQLEEGRRALFAHRETRVRPGLDDKVLAAWNGLAVAAFASAARIFDRLDYRTVAERAAAFCVDRMRTPDGRLFRAWRVGAARLNAYLEDYANLAYGLLALYEVTFDPRWFVEAKRLVDTMVNHYHDPQGGFFDTSHDHETLVVRPKDHQDNATPSGGAMAAMVLLRLGALTGDGRYRDLAEAALRPMQPAAASYPTAFAWWLCALDFALDRPREVAIIGDPASADTRAMLDVVLGPYRPNQVVAVGRPGEVSPVPLLAGRGQLGSRATAYVCERGICRLPVDDPQALAAQLT